MNKNYMRQVLLKKLGDVKEVLNKAKEFLAVKTQEMFVKEIKEVNYEEEMELFERCISVICSCQNPEQRINARRYIALAAKKITEGLQDREEWIKAVNEETLLHLITVK